MHMIQYVTYENLFQLLLLLVGIVGLFITIFMHKK